MLNKNLLSIFVVNEDVSSLDLNKLQLNAAGYTNIRLFSQAPDCFDLIAEETPDIILLNHEVYPLYGLDMLLGIKKIYVSIKIAILSEQEEISNAVDAMLTGATNYVIKGHDAFIKWKKYLIIL